MINQLVGKYKITKLLGEGGMASVYEGIHEILGTKVAIKILNPILTSNTQIKERFINEARLMASLNHPNIVKVIDFDDQSGQLSIVMEYLEGEDLNELIKKKGALPEKDILNYFNQSLYALQYAHEKGIVHRDIKPSNIFVLPNGNIKILDFGIAKLFGQGNEMTQTGTQIGTPIYMSPEQVKSEKSIDHRSDIYSLGVTLYFAVYGKPPYDINSISQFEIFNKIVFEPIHLVRDSSFNSTIKKACDKNRDSRFQFCQQWIDSMNNIDDSNHSKVEKTIQEPTTLEIDNKYEEIDDFETVKNRNKFYIILASFVILSFVLTFYFTQKDRVTSPIVDLSPPTDEVVTNFSNDLITDSTEVAGTNFSNDLITDSAEVAGTNFMSINSLSIGNQIWMTENLNVSYFQNGDEIPEAKTDEEWKRAGERREPAWCYYDNDPLNGEKYGKLYNWYAVNDERGIAPEGWHVASDNEWRELVDYVGGDEIAGSKLKSKSGWYDNGNGSDGYGFSGLPGGYRGIYGTFYNIVSNGDWWSSTKYKTGYAWYRNLGYYRGNVSRNYFGKGNGFSVRCLKD